ncbi:MAG: hypothetical protein JRL30_29310, partial [Deltaproteobacteria bacterium]|nr:hypothetical protein [Deltaproteobacteria bacterium]
MSRKENKKKQQHIFNELREIREKAHLGGGEASIEAQHKKGKETARERVLSL